MTKDQILAHLREWQDAMQAAEAAMDSLYELLGNDPESPMPQAIAALQGLATRQAGQLLGWTDEWLMAWWLEHSFGTKSMQVLLPGQQWREVMTLEDLAQLVADDMAMSEEGAQ